MVMVAMVSDDLDSDDNCDGDLDLIVMTIVMAIVMTSDDRNAADCSSVSLPSQSQRLTEARDAVRDSVRDSVVTW